VARLEEVILMGAAEKDARGRGRRARPGSVVGQTRGEETLIGTTGAGELPDDPVVKLTEVFQLHRVQNKTLLGLLFLLVQVLVLGVLAMTGVALDWFDQGFAMQVLAITVSPSFTAWLLVVRWAFRKGGRGG
jgi:hypothetical protein